MKIGMLLFDNLTQLDLTGPYEVFNKIPDVQIFLTSERKEPIRSDGGLCIVSDTTFDDCPQLDILFVPGGPGVLATLENPTVIAFLKHQAVKAQYITSVCTGALVLAAADLLRGYHATTHWLSLDLLTTF